MGGIVSLEIYFYFLEILFKDHSKLENNLKNPFYEKLFLLKTIIKSQQNECTLIKSAFILSQNQVNNM